MDNAKKTTGEPAIPDIASLLTPKQAAEILKVDPASIRRWIRIGALPAYKIGSRVRVAREDVEGLLVRAETDEDKPRPLTKREIAREAAETDRILREAKIRR